MKIDVDEKEQLVARGRVAEELLTHPVMVEAFRALELKLFREWKESKDEEERRLLWAQSHNLDQLQGQLRVIISQGQHAGAVLQKRQ